VELRAGDAEAVRRGIDDGVELANRWAQTTDVPLSRYWVGVMREARAKFFLGETGDAAGALAESRAAVAIFTKLVAAEPASVTYRHELAHALVRVGDFLGGAGDGELWHANLDDRAGAEDAMRAAIAELEVLVAHDANDMRARSLLASTRAALGSYLAEHDV